MMTWHRISLNHFFRDQSILPEAALKVPQKYWDSSESRCNRIGHQYNFLIQQTIHTFFCFSIFLIFYIWCSSPREMPAENASFSFNNFWINHWAPRILLINKQKKYNVVVNKIGVYILSNPTYHHLLKWFEIFHFIFSIDDFHYYFFPILNFVNPRIVSFVQSNWTNK